jgi:hypothetical protein
MYVHLYYRFTNLLHTSNMSHKKEGQNLDRLITVRLTDSEYNEMLRFSALLSARDQKRRTFADVFRWAFSLSKPTIEAELAGNSVQNGHTLTDTQRGLIVAKRILDLGLHSFQNQPQPSHV